MRENFPKSLKLVLKHEGGYVNHPRDPGGATNKGIIQKTYDSWRIRQGLKPRSVKNITDEEVAAIYKRDYWDAVKADHLPGGVDHAVFDFAVNSGPSRSVRFLQTVLGKVIDGRMGPATLAAAKERPPQLVIQHLCAKRMTFLRNLPHWDAFGKGWTRRVKEVETQAMSMVEPFPPQQAAVNSIKTLTDVPVTVTEPVEAPQPVPVNPGWTARLAAFFKGKKA